MTKVGLKIIVFVMIILGLSVIAKLQAQPSGDIAKENQIKGDQNRTDQEVKVTVASSFEETKQKAEAGDMEAQFNLGNMYAFGTGTEPDFQQAAQWFRKSAEQGHKEAQYSLGDMYRTGDGVKQDYKQAMQWLRKAADLGHAGAQNNLGVMYCQGQGVEQDYKQAAQWFRRAAEQGFAKAQHNLGLIYDRGQGIEKDSKQAAQWYRKAAEQGHAIAQNNLGMMYDNGQGVEQDSKRAVQWLRKAAEQGYAKAQCNLGVMYDNGQGVEKDFTQAAQWYRKAAEQGHAKAQFNLGVMYDRGQGIEKDSKQAAQWYRKAAEQGYASAQINFGVMYLKGQAVVEDFTEAYKWFLLAGMNGADVSKQKAYLSGKMTPGQIAEAQRLAKEFVPKKEGVDAKENDPFGMMERSMKVAGTGFFIDAKGTILTANHVIEKAKTIRIMAGDKVLDAKVLAADAGLDIAILKVEGQGFEWLPIAASAGVKAGEKIFTVGYPNYAIQGTEPKYTEGVVNSVTGAMNNPRLFQVSAQVQPGNSGGPLVTEAGQVIGVVVQRLSDLGMLEATGMVAQSVNYAVKSSFVLPLLEGIEGWTRPEGKAEKPDRTAIIERARKAAVMVMGY